MLKVSDLQMKDVVSIVDGKRLGTIGDLDIDLENGIVKAIIVPGPSRFFGLFGSDQDTIIPWNQIIKIGADVVLVDTSTPNPSYLPPKSSGGSGGY